MRLVEADIRDRLEDQRTSLEEQMQEKGHLTEEAAVRRAYQLLAPQVLGLRQRLDLEMPTLREFSEAACAECQEGLKSLQAEHGIQIGQLGRELVVMGGELHEVGTGLERTTKGLEKLNVARQETMQALESVRSEVLIAAEVLHNRLAEVSQRVATTIEERWCRRLQERLDATEAALHDLDGRSGIQASSNLGSLKLLEDSFLSRLEMLRSDVLEKAKMHADEATTSLRAELDSRLVGEFERRLHEYQVCSEARMAALAGELRDHTAAAARDALASAERSSEARTSSYAGESAELVDAVRREAAAEMKRREKMEERWSQQLREARVSSDAADTLLRSTLEALSSRTEGLEQELLTLRGNISENQLSLDESLSSIRGEVRERASKTELAESTDIIKAGLRDSLARVDALAASMKGQSKWLEDRVKQLAERCCDAEREASAATQRMQHEAAAVNDEVCLVRAAATSLTHGVLRIAHVLGLIRGEPQSWLLQSAYGPSQRRNRGFDVSDLLQWEERGQSLASQVVQQWSPYEEAGAPNVLALLDRKAHHSDIRSIRSAMGDRRLARMNETASTMFTTTLGTTSGSPVSEPSAKLEHLPAVCFAGSPRSSKSISAPKVR